MRGTLAALALTTRALALDPNPTAEVLAGLSKDAAQAGDEKAGVLEGYTKKVVELWQSYETKIARSIRDWGKTELKSTPGETIFYPFAGPDFPTVQLLYPDAGRYVLVALQTGGRVPDMSGMSKDQLNVFLKAFRRGWESFTLRGFYDTDDLKRDTGKKAVLEGITPALMAFAVRLGYIIDKVEPVRIPPTAAIPAGAVELEVHPGDRNAVATWDSVRLHLRTKDGGRKVTLDYVYLDLSDPYLKKNPSAMSWVTAMSKHRVVTKAASHLMQKPFFSMVKDAILSHAPSVWQDETGIDFAELREAFEVTLYGKFTKANKLFIEGIQRSLAKAYKERKDIRPLPFKVGYKKESGSCVQVAVRKK